MIVEKYLFSENQQHSKRFLSEVHTLMYKPVWLLFWKEKFKCRVWGSDAEYAVCIMDFCPDCGTRLISKREKDGTKTTIQIICPKCGYKKQRKQKPNIPAKTINRSRKESITVIAKEHQIRTLPTAKVACPKCGNNLAYTWQVQTRGGDEGSTIFFRCTKCDHTFREYT